MRKLVQTVRFLQNGTAVDAAGSLRGYVPHVQAGHVDRHRPAARRRPARLNYQGPATHRYEFTMRSIVRELMNVLLLRHSALHSCFWYRSPAFTSQWY